MTVQKVTASSAASETGRARLAAMKIPAPAAPSIAPTIGKKIAARPGGTIFALIGMMVRNETAARNVRIT